MNQIDRLLQIMAALRDPDSGCPWDKTQTFATILPYTIEETYEVAEAIDQGDMASLREELGDLLFQVVFHAQMAKEAGHFDFDDVVESICDKLERRHPHVFADAVIEDAEAQSHAWERHKQRERRARAQSSLMDDIPHALPGLMRAMKLQRRAARAGFDWDSIEPVLAKIEEELAEVRREIDNQGSHERLTHEVGDLIFACTNLARHLQVEPEEALRGVNNRFESRFRRIEALLAEQGKRVEEASLEELDALWELAKGEEH